jgi:hypothetical protein
MEGRGSGGASPLPIAQTVARKNHEATSSLRALNQALRAWLRA